VKKDMLTQEEADWLNTYHRIVRKKLSLHLDKEEREWLERATQSI
jgi:Xaa-Pro aminopeptidase